MAGCGCCGCSVGFDCASVTFSDVLLDCGCLLVGDGTSTVYSDIGEFNGIPTTLTNFTSGCCVHSPGGCCWRSVFPGSSIFHRVRFWGNTTCSGTPIIDSTSTISVFLVFVSGIYYLIAFGTNLAPLFYGTSATLSGTFMNTAFCTPSGPVVWDNPLIECIFGASLTRLGAGEDGTATIEIITCP